MLLAGSELLKNSVEFENEFVESFGGSEEIIVSDVG